MKKYIIAAVVAVAVFASAAFAASLDVNAGKLQAGQGQIGTCITDDVVVTYGEPEFEVISTEPDADPVWTVEEIELDHDGLCDGLAYSVIITGDDTKDGIPTQVVTGTFGPGTQTVEFDPFDAEGATDVHLVIRTATQP
jgi:hypothetical protein